MLGDAHIAAVAVHLHVFFQFLQKSFLLLLIIVGKQNGIVNFPSSFLNFPDKGKQPFLHFCKKAVVHCGVCSHLVAVQQIVVIGTGFIKVSKNFFLALNHLFQMRQKQ